MLRNVITGEASDLPVDGIFVFVGQRPNTEFLQGMLELDANGFIVTDEEMRTAVPGLFAAGDVRHKTLRQMVTATGDGAVAANTADHYLEGYSH